MSIARDDSAVKALLREWRSPIEPDANAYECERAIERQKCADAMETALRAENLSPQREVAELVAAARELRQRQRDYLSEPKGQRLEAKGRLVGVAAERLDAALAAFD